MEAERLQIPEPRAAHLEPKAVPAQKAALERKAVRVPALERKAARRAVRERKPVPNPVRKPAAVRERRPVRREAPAIALEAKPAPRIPERPAKAGRETLARLQGQKVPQNPDFPS